MSPAELAIALIIPVTIWAGVAAHAVRRWQSMNPHLRPPI